MECKRVCRGCVAKCWVFRGAWRKKVRKKSRMFLLLKNNLEKTTKGQRLSAAFLGPLIFHTFALKGVDGEFVLRACLSYLEVSGKDKEAKQRKRRGLGRLGRFGRLLLGSKSQEADKKF